MPLNNRKLGLGLTIESQTWSTNSLFCVVKKVNFWTGCLLESVKVGPIGTPPYDHPVYKTTSLLRPYSFKPNVKTIESCYYFEDPVNATTSLLRPGFYGPTVVALTGFHTFVLSFNKKMLNSVSETK